MLNFLNIRTAFIIIFSIIAIYIMYLKSENEVLQTNLDIQRDLYKSTKQALEFQKSKSNFEKQNLNNIAKSIKAKENTRYQDIKRGLVDDKKFTNTNFTIVSF